ncbi:MAG: hypothetical protein A2600_07495 [Candidatus Lambdaproteobacteria bacterium RIFOXYD1_FULL_56_27]|uniref:Uncharacterized protein n=1 Tax=Candidatus Lambdaproteobacteria bacterium RIFOXYD2_FULL_56_26 TaxID=1817773 RepID=A0A1F6GNF9_9PROT|nr:MAG: hypothetical protein A2557_09020 [Candidatus Lambdaproteobacteria bacterium RIFOXYD2_FULL_56_26]OGH05514.1 MAG: hypothetical protein A2426_03960 [Candidatus Lambdaproteobacteria bacterium RIFOXYC1_FULL_56_13]OGH09711.1 MAG: hypothetical protein A2600_07495 [Candidatus Lambdaproteobacteria bacterium RIFOXYD1_FULL_56_27]
MGRIRFVNNFESQVVGSVAPGATQLTLNDATPLGTLPPGDYYRATLSNSSAFEVVLVTGITGNLLEVIRAQESTLPLAYSTGDLLQIRDTAGTLDEFVQYNDVSWVGRNLVVNGAGRVFQRAVGSPIATTKSAALFGPDRFRGYAPVGVMDTGTITQGTGVPVGKTGCAAKFEGVTSVWGGQLAFLYRLEGADACRLKGSLGSLSALVFQDSGQPVSVTCSLSRPTGLDNFAALTPLFTGTPVSLPTAIGKRLTQEGIDFSAFQPELGLEIQVLLEFGAVTNANFYLTDLQLEVGARATPFEYKSFFAERNHCLRYYEHSVPYGVVPWATGLGANTPLLVRAGSPSGAHYFMHCQRFLVEKHHNPTLNLRAEDTGELNRISFYNAAGAFVERLAPESVSVSKTAFLLKRSLGSNYVTAAFHYAAEAEL